MYLLCENQNVTSVSLLIHVLCVMSLHLVLNGMIVSSTLTDPGCSVHEVQQ